MLCWATWTLEFFSRTIDISPVRVKALANPGPSDKGSGLPRGPQPRRSPAVPCLSPGRPQLLTSPSRWTRWSRSSCASRGPRECTRLPAPNATGTASVRPTLRPLPCPQDASAARPLPRPHLHGPLSVPHRQTRLPARLLSAVSLGAVPISPLKPSYLTEALSQGKPKASRAPALHLVRILFFLLQAGPAQHPLPATLVPGPGSAPSRSGFHHCHLFLWPPSLGLQRGGNRLRVSGCCVQTGWEAAAGIAGPVSMSEGRGGQHGLPAALVLGVSRFVPSLWGG